MNKKIVAKNVLIINISTDVKSENILDIYCHGHSHNMNVSHETVNNIEEFERALLGKNLDYLFLAGHANEECFTNKTFFHQSWAEIGEMICSSECLNENAILMLYCCKGGMVPVAYTLFAECPNIRYVIGGKQNMYPIQLTVGFNVFMYHVEFRKTDPVLSAKKATDATDIRFECFDRVDAEVNPHWHNVYCKDCQKNNDLSDTCYSFNFIYVNTNFFIYLILTNLHFITPSPNVVNMRIKFKH